MMSPAELKPMLLLSKRQPVNCAIGMTKDKHGVILLDKRMKPRKVAALMKTQAKSKNIDLDMPSLRFGKAEVDTDRDSSLVTFTVNKDVPGALRPKLLEHLKKAGFNKCEITVDTTLENEPDVDAEDGKEAKGAAGAADGGAGQAGPGGGAAHQADGAAGGPATAAGPAELTAGQPAPAAQGAADTQAAGETSPDSTPAPTAESGQPGTQDPSPGSADPAALTKRLTELVKAMMVTTPSDEMKTAAKAAQAALKSGDLTTAAKQVDALEKLVHPQGTATASADPNAPATGGPPPQGQAGPAGGPTAADPPAAGTQAAGLRPTR